MTWSWIASPLAHRATALHILTTTLLAGLLLAGLALIWPQTPGVALATAERLQVTAIVGLCGAGAALLASLIGGRERWAGAAVVLLPTAVTLALAVAPRRGRLHIHLDDGWVWAAALVAVVLAGLLRTRARPAIAGALGLWILAGIAIAWPATPGARRSDPGAGPDLLLITLDTVRADHLQVFGGEVPTSHTPHLAALAAQSVVFRQAFAPVALTGPSHTSMFSGIPPVDHGVWTNGDVVDDGLVWIPQLLQQAGWSTRGFVSAAVLDSGLGYARGFDTFDSAFVRRPIRGHGLVSFLGYRPRKGSDHSRPSRDTVALVTPPGSRRTFTWVHLYDAHWPYQPGEQAAARHGLEDNSPLPGGMRLPFARNTSRLLDPQMLDRGRRLYRAGIDDLDGLIGELLAATSPGTMVVVAGDHGEHLGEHDYPFTHGRLPYAPSTRVPLMVRAPGWDPAVVDELVSLLDVGPTLLTLAGVEVPAPMASPPLDQRIPDRVVVSTCFPFAERADDNPPSTKPGIFSGLAVRQGTRTAAWSLDVELSTYDRSTDPRELLPVAAAMDDPLVLRLQREIATAEPRDSLPTGADIREALEALGYVE